MRQTCYPRFRVFSHEENKSNAKHYLNDRVQVISIKIGDLDSKLLFKKSGDAMF